MAKCPELMPMLKKTWCQRPNYFRAKIQPLEGCDSDKNFTIKNGLCYEKCADGYIESETSNFCWKECEKEFDSFGD